MVSRGSFAGTSSMVGDGVGSSVGEFVVSSTSVTVGAPVGDGVRGGRVGDGVPIVAAGVGAIVSVSSSTEVVVVTDADGASLLSSCSIRLFLFSNCTVERLSTLSVLLPRRKASAACSALAANGCVSLFAVASNAQITAVQTKEETFEFIVVVQEKKYIRL